MTAAIGNWIYGIVAAAMISAVTLMLSPENKAKRVVSVVCGFMILIALIKPLRDFDYGSFKQNYAALRDDAENFSAPLEEVNENLTRRIIEEKYAAYILDKGTALGIPWLEVTVSVGKTDSELYYPDSVTIKTDGDAAQRNSLAYEIEAGLGIPSGELIWGDSNG